MQSGELHEGGNAKADSSSRTPDQGPQTAGADSHNPVVKPIVGIARDDHVISGPADARAGGTAVSAASNGKSIPGSGGIKAESAAPAPPLAKPD